MQKMVNGKVVDMTPAEIVQRQAEDAAFENERVNPKPVPRTVEEEVAALKTRLAALEAAGPRVP